MGNRYTHHQRPFAVAVTNENASADLAANPGSEQYVVYDKLHISVFKAADTGGLGGGILEIKDTVGTVLHTFNVDEVKEISVNLGTEEGHKIGPNLGLQAVLSGAGTQASVSITGNTYIAFRPD